MKKFLSGVFCATLVFSLALSALAISGKITIEVDPINIQVNGETFAPTDVTGKEVPVFAYQGTTYAPLRALAEAYGLEVGYDAKANMATVTDPSAKPVIPAPDTTTKADYSDWSAEDEAAYQEFKGMWKVKVGTETNAGFPFNTATVLCEKTAVETLSSFLSAHSPEEIDHYSFKLLEDINQMTPNTRLVFRAETEIGNIAEVLWHCYKDNSGWYCGYSEDVDYVAKILG